MGAGPWGAFDDALPRVQARTHDDETSRWLELGVRICPLEQVTPYSVLFHNIDVYLGQLVVDDGMIWFVQAVPHERLEPRELRLLGRALTHEADGILQALSARVATAREDMTP